MSATVRILERYLSEALNVQVTARLWPGARHLPLFLIQRYEFYEITLFNYACLLMVARDDQFPTPAVVRRHWEVVGEKWEGRVIYVQETTTSYNRKRLIQQNVPFVIPNTQVYLIGLGINLLEYYPQPKPKRTHFRPATQAMLIYALCRKSPFEYTATHLIGSLAYTRMTLMRSFDVLEQFEIGRVQRNGKERCWHFDGSRRELWRLMQPYLKNPVQRRIWVRGGHLQMKAGLTALALRSHLSEPEIPVYAVSGDEWKGLREAIEILPTSEEAEAEVEFWSYDPNLLSDDDVVDPFSLYSSLMVTDDDRIEAALETMMEELGCSEG